MPEKENGPFWSEREALATRSAAVIRAAFDARPGVGAGDEARLTVMTDACAASGVDLGDYDRRLLEWLAHWEDGNAISLAGMIRRAYLAGMHRGSRNRA